VTTLVGAMAGRAGKSVRVGGNLGTPALDLIAASEPDLYVLELSSFQLETTQSLDAAAAVVLNVSPDHMDRYATLADYTATKRRVYRGHGVMVLNADDPTVLAMAVPARPQLRFTLGAPRNPDEFGLVERAGVAWLAQGATPLIAEAELRIAGRHNTANALAALALGNAVGLPVEAMCAALRAFTGLAHRTHFVAERRGVRYYNDSKGTNVGATLAAIEGLPGRLVLIAGGDGKGQDFAPLAAPLARKARAVVLIGRDAPLIEAAIAGQAPCAHAVTLEEAVQQAAALAQPGDSVLLSPACASFDMFKSYVERGERFAAAVQDLPA
jgi:UDP-N-acetylmuramoylalanine--D-glutamate ligase